MEYANHFLTNVIFRIDFVSEKEELKNNLDRGIKEACVKKFPIQESIEIEQKEVQVQQSEDGGKTITQSTEKTTEWHFWGKNREKKLVITKNSMFIDFTKYKSFIEFKADFNVACKALQEVYPDININRIGLRYIDQIKINDMSTVKTWKTYWNKYISSELVNALQFPDEDKAISRHMTSVEMNYGECMLRFQYGMFNNDYPAPNKRKEFVIDTDVYSLGLFEMGEVEDQMDLFHEKAEAWFEKSIKEALRKKMGVTING